VLIPPEEDDISPDEPADLADEESPL